jgi:hypothetical protein
LATICSTEYFFAGIEHLQLVSHYFWDSLKKWTSFWGAGQFEFRFWSGARDLNPGPHGPELCDTSFRNGGNDRFLFEVVAPRLGGVVIWDYLFAGLLHELLLEIPDCPILPDEASAKLVHEVSLR